MPIPIPQTECDIDALAAELLRFCRKQSSHLRAAYQQPHLLDGLAAWRLSLRDWFRTLDDDVLFDTDLADLAAKLAEGENIATQALGNASSAMAVTARWTAQALDAALGIRIQGLWRARGARQLAPGDPFPVAVLPFEPPRKLSRILGPEIDELDHLGILDDGATSKGHEIWIEPQLGDILAEVDENSRIALLLPNSGVGHLDFTCVQRGSCRYFTQVVLRDPPLQRQLVLELLRKADQQGARIALLPELCIDDTGVEEVAQWFDRGASSLRLIVCGSTHTRDGDGNWRNVSTTLVRGHRLTHSKFNPYVLRNCPKCGQRVEHFENVITTPARITTYFCGSWSFTTLICKDFLDPPMPEVAGQMRVSLVLVPACSDNTGPFVGAATALVAGGSQVRVAITNSAPPRIGTDPAVLLWGTPQKGMAVPETVTMGEIETTPFARLFSLRGNI